MPLAIGRVERLQISDSLGIVRVRIANKVVPTLGVGPPDPPSKELIIWKGKASLGPKDLFVTELSRALAQGLRVRVFYTPDNEFITEVTVEAPFEGSLV